MRLVILLLLAATAYGQDLEGSTDPPGMKRYAGTEIIGYRAPKFDEFVLPLAAPTAYGPVAYTKSQTLTGRVSRYTYLAPAGRTAAELLRNYKTEFSRLGVTILFEKAAGERGWFGPTFQTVGDEDGLGQILMYNEAQERVIAGRSKTGAHYFVFVTAYKDGVIPEALRDRVGPDRALAHVAVVEPEAMEKRMEFVNAAEMTQALGEVGKVVLYGIYFETDKDTMLPASEPTLKEIVKLLADDPNMKVRIVGHTDNQGTANYNLELSRRRAGNILKALTAQYGVDAARLDSFGCGLYAPVAANESDEGRARNRRVELVRW